MSELAGPAIADHDIGTMFDDGTNELADRCGRILVVAVSVYDDVGPETKAGIQAAEEGAREPLLPRGAHHLTHARAPCDRRGFVG